ncbi:MAG: CDGSH iron-sulfur domain-containing protein [Candidatus Bathyarchaeota archaeon]|nr:CDGSH iron-sulfur domain-containing protein [Candidatus Bathyarchaeota archaeon]
MYAGKGKIKITKDGPYLVTGNIQLREMIIGADADGFSEKWREGKEHPHQENYTLCRCGKTKDKPFCDGSHISTRFNGKETATREPFEKQADMIEGPKLNLMDAQDFCAFARFCDRGDGVWSYTHASDDPAAKKAAIEEACNCPSGRLVAVDKETNKTIEPDLDQSIGVVEDPKMGCSGPLWVRGGVPVEGADGMPYETRNRVTLCRCGKSGNKPFCDGTHAS